MSSVPAPPALLIAEAGVNHNGDLGLAFDLIDAAADSGANLIKFQTFSAKAMVSKSAALAPVSGEIAGLRADPVRHAARVGIRPRCPSAVARALC